MGENIIKKTFKWKADLKFKEGFKQKISPGMPKPLPTPQVAHWTQERLAQVTSWMGKKEPAENS